MNGELVLEHSLFRTRLGDELREQRPGGIQLTRMKLEVWMNADGASVHHPCLGERAAAVEPRLHLRRRGAGLGGGNDEREQTLNQMLVEMDGFETGMGVIVIAATNRPDVLDPALLRPGRFDRQVVVPLPDIRGREQILNVHMRKVPIGADVKADVIARGTPGFSGADLANLVNEAALFAARRSARVVEMTDFEKAKDKVMMGAERKSMVMSDEERLNTAYHESGHTLVAKLVPKSDPVHKVTIIPRGRALGLTMQLPEQDRYAYDRQYLLSRIAVLFGGRIAEEVFMPLTDEELQKDGLTQFPTVIGGVVPVVNIPGIATRQMKLTGQVLGDIYLGKITRWNDPAIVALNPGLKLPDAQISPVRRADGSGTTFIFTNYLSKVNPDWKSKVGEGTAVNWPAGAGGKGNEGVSAFVQRLPNSIGYVEYAYAKQNKMTYALLQNAAGAFVAPEDAAFKAAAVGADWSKSFYQILTNQPGKDAWPITGATFIMMHLKQDKPQQAAASLKFFDWAYANGDKMADELDYVPLPDSVEALIRQQWSKITDTAGKPVYTR